MSRRTTWTRLEPRPRTGKKGDAAMRDGLRAEVRDPLWLLSRQWQVSEFEGEDAGSPVRVDLDIAEDHLSRVDLRGGGRGGEDGPAGPFDYEGDPLEATVERERVMTDDDPPTRLRAEAGQQFLRTLSDRGYGDHSAADFPEQFRLDAPDQPLESPDRRYVELMADRALDGTAVARAIQSAVGNLDAVIADDSSWSVTGASLPLPENGSRTSLYEDCVEEYYAWYVDVYDEPTTETGSAWDPTRLEYRFSVATGDSDTETVFDAPEYRGGRLAWYDFSPDRTGDSLNPPADGATTTRETTVMPTQISFPGMPASRWWELEDGAVDLSQLSADGAPLSRLMLLEFATVYGNDWFQIPVETPVGTLSRITDLTVTDTFGVEETASAALDDEWQLFSQELPGHDEAGLFLPPTLPSPVTGDPVEKVVFARDELANLAFGIERRYEGATGRSVDRTEFHEPHVAVEDVTASDDPDREFLELANPGEDRLDVSGYEIEAVIDGDPEPIHTFGDRELGPDESVRIYTGSAAESGDVGLGLSASIWTSASSLSIRDGSGTLVRRHLLAGPSDALADYRLSTDVADYWFPFTAERDEAFRLERALLLDADSLGLPPEELPRPRGEILDPPDSQLPADEETYRLYDEEVPRSGRTVTRQYQFARWTDGRGYLWSSRESGVGDTQLASGLLFDILEERE